MFKKITREDIDKINDFMEDEIGIKRYWQEISSKNHFFFYFLEMLFEPLELDSQLKNIICALFKLLDLQVVDARTFFLNQQILTKKIQSSLVIDSPEKKNYSDIERIKQEALQLFNQVLIDQDPHLSAYLRFLSLTIIDVEKSVMAKDKLVEMLFYLAPIQS